MSASFTATKINPAPGSASALIATTAAPYKSYSSAIPSNFEKPLIFKPILDVDILKQDSINNELEAKTKIEKRTLATKEIQIVLPNKSEDTCRDVSEYNNNKTLAGNIIDHIICNTQDLIKRIGYFF